MAEVDLSTTVGRVALPNPVMTASGTAGHGAELSAFFDLTELGAVVVKSLSPFAWEGNPAPRVHETVAGMINSVGLQNPGVRLGAGRSFPSWPTRERESSPASGVEQSRTIIRLRSS